MDLRTTNRQLNSEEFAGQALVLRSHPVSAWVSFTGRCNLNCAHCPRRSISPVVANGPDMHPALFECLEKDIFPYLDRCKVGGNNLGEQLLSLQWDRFFERLNRFPFQRNLVTNGLALGEKNAEQLIDNNWIIDFSTEGATGSTYRAIRGGSFDKFRAAVRSCCEHNKYAGSGQGRVRLCYTVFYDNIRELKDLVSFASDLGVNEIIVTHLIPMRESQRDQSLVYHKGLANSIFNEALRLAESSGISLMLPPLFRLNRINGNEPSDDNTGTAWEDKKCHHPWTSVSIDEKGDVFPCCLFDFPAGNLHKESFQKIWNSRLFRKLRKTVNSPNPISTCRHCPLRGTGFTSVKCNDDQALLSIIGITNTMDSRSFLKIKTKELMRSSLWENVYMKHIRSTYKRLFS